MGIYLQSLFGASKIDYRAITDIQSQAGNLIVYAIPFMAIFTGIEIIYSWYHNKRSYNAKESVGSLLVGLGNVALNLLAKFGLIYGSVFIYNLVPWRMSLNWWTFIPCLVVFDLASYWAHRVAHSNRFFWATHVVHHSAENYNLTVSFRLSWIQHLKLIFFLPIAFFGFHPVIFFLVNQVSILLQFWQHTEHIKKLNPFIENILVTPSTHRVHHGSNEKYLDKNFGAVFVFWDKIFNTYQSEEEIPVFGLTTKIKRSLNPFYLNFHEMRDIISDLRKTKKIKVRLFFLFGNPARIARYKSLVQK